MLHFNIVSVFPEYFSSFFETGVIGRAFSSGLASYEVINPRDFALDRHKTVDHPPYGGGDGMLMSFNPLNDALLELQKKSKLGKVVAMSPQGIEWNYKQANQWSRSEQPVTFICGRYAGIDQRVVETWVDEEVSIGDFVISGGELATQCVIDSVLRFVPGVLGDSNSPIEESFNHGVLEAPQYTKPREAGGLPVPEVLLSGHHKNIELWKQSASIVLTFIRRRDLYDSANLDPTLLATSVNELKKMKELELKAMGLSYEILDKVLQKC